MIYNPRTRKRERVSRVMMIQADKRIDVETTFLPATSPRWWA